MGWDYTTFYWNYTEISLLLLMTNFNAIVLTLQYVVGFTQIGRFFWYHEWSSSCNHIRGVVYIDSALAIISTMATYILLFPVFYTILYTSVPGLASKPSDAISSRKHHIFDVKLTSFLPKLVQGYLYKANSYLSLDIWMVFKLAYKNVNYMNQKATTILYNHRLALKILEALRSEDENYESISSTKNPMLDMNINSANDGNSFKVTSVNSTLSKSLKLSLALSDEISEVEISEYHKSSSINAPSYYSLSFWVYEDLSLKFKITDDQRVLQACLMLLSFSFFGHMLTTVGRYSWRLTLRKLYVFFSVSLGIWTDESYEFYQHVDLTKGLIELKRDEFFYVLEATLAVRSIFFQLCPVLTVLSIFVQETSGSPIFVYSSKLLNLLPPMFFTRKEAIALAKKQELLPQDWTIFLRTVHNMFCEGRVIRFTLGFSKVIIALSLVIESDKQISNSTLSLVIVICSTVVIPYFFFYSLKYIVFIGNLPMFSMKDSDFEDILDTFKLCSHFLRGYRDDDDIDDNDDDNVEVTAVDPKTVRVSDRVYSSRIDEGNSIQSNRIDEVHNSIHSNRIDEGDKEDDIDNEYFGNL